MALPPWPPSAKIPDYKGPYSLKMLEDARQTLISCLMYDPSTILQRAKPKVGLRSPYGEPLIPPPVGTPSGFFLPQSIGTSMRLPPGHSPPKPLMNPTQRPPSNIAPLMTSSSALGSRLSTPSSTATQSQAQGSGQRRETLAGNARTPEVSHSYTTAFSNTSLVSVDSGISDDSITVDYENRSTPGSSTVSSRPGSNSREMKPNIPRSNLRFIDTQPEINQNCDSKAAVSQLFPGPASVNAVHSVDRFNDVPDLRVLESWGMKNYTVTVDPTPPRNDHTTKDLKRKGSVDFGEMKCKVTRESPDDKLANRNNALTTAGIFLVYKCDFCMYNSPKRHEMEAHLVNAKHFSGSIYNARNGDKGVEMISLEKMLALKNRHSKSKALVVACPQCRELFEDIFMCGLHHKYTHGSVNGFYSICPIIQHETIMCSQEAKCERCLVKFSRHKELHAHWQNCPDHHPLTPPSNPNIFLLAICPYCRMTFYNSFLGCKMHVLKHGEEWCKPKCAVEVKHIMLPHRKDELLPFNTAGSGHGALNDELTILKNMKQHFKQMASSKDKLANIRSRIRIVKSQLSLFDETDSD